MFVRLAHFCYHRRRFVLLGWVVLLVGLLFLSNTVGGTFRTDFKLPNSESTQAMDILKDNGFGENTGVQASVVFEAAQGVKDPAVQQAIEGLLAKVATVPNTSVVSPYTPEGASQISQDGTIAYAQVNLADRENDAYTTAADQIKEYRNEVNVPGLRVELGGDIFSTFEAPSSELIGILAAVFILLIAFGSLLAMGLPILTALFGIGCGIALVQLFANFTSVPDFTTQLAAMIGIGVGIDYALFIVTRYRQALHDGLEPENAVVLAINTAGRAVLFAGTTVVISLLGMFLMGLAFVRSLAVGAVLAVLMTMLAALTLLPAVLGFVGPQHRQVRPAPQEAGRGSGPAVVLVPLEPDHPAPPVAGVRRRPPHPGAARHPVPLAAPRLLRRRQRRHRRRPRARRTTCCRRASAPATTAR